MHVKPPVILSSRQATALFSDYLGLEF